MIVELHVLASYMIFFGLSLRYPRNKEIRSDAKKSYVIFKLDV